MKLPDRVKSGGLPAGEYDWESGRREIPDFQFFKGGLVAHL